MSKYQALRKKLDGVLDTQYNMMQDWVDALEDIGPISADGIHAAIDSVTAEMQDVLVAVSDLNKWLTTAIDLEQEVIDELTWRNA